MIQFEAFPKIPRYRREVALTEKIDLLENDDVPKGLVK